MDDISTNSPAMPEAVAPEAAVETPNPINHEPQPKPEVKAVEKVEKPTARQALEAAAAKVEASEKTAVARETKAANAAETAKGEKVADPKAPITDESKIAKADTTAKTETKVASTNNEAPSRFNTDAKTAWATAPESVKAETTRAIRELEAGLIKHKEAAEAYEPIRKFADIAKANDTTVHEALERYVNIDKGLVSKDTNTKAAAIEQVLQAAGTTPAEYAAWVTNGGKATQTQAQSDPIISELKQQVEALKQQLGQVSTSIQSQQDQDYVAQINQWKADKPMVDVLANEIAHYVENEGLTLDDAYVKAKTNAEETARKLGFIPSTQSKPSQEVAQTQLLKSITGAPGSGSNPAARVPSNTISESIRRAAARVA
jgi:hypothetical protein